MKKLNKTFSSDRINFHPLRFIYFLLPLALLLSLVFTLVEKRKYCSTRASEKLLTFNLSSSFSRFRDNVRAF